MDSKEVIVTKSNLDIFEFILECLLDFLFCFECTEYRSLTIVVWVMSDSVVSVRQMFRGLQYVCIVHRN